MSWGEDKKIFLKRHRVVERIRKQDTHSCLQKTQFRSKDTHRRKVEGRKKILYAKRNEKKLGSTTHIRQNRL